MTILTIIIVINFFIKLSQMSFFVVNPFFLKYRNFFPKLFIIYKVEINRSFTKKTKTMIYVFFKPKRCQNILEDFGPRLRREEDMHTFLSLQSSKKKQTIYKV